VYLKLPRFGKILNILSLYKHIIIGSLLIAGWWFWLHWDSFLSTVEWE